MIQTFAYAPVRGKMPHRHSLGSSIRSSTVLLLAVIATLIVALALLILFHHNLNATKGYRLRTLEYARTQLLLEQEILSMRIAESQSLASLEKTPQIQAMRKPSRPAYAADAESRGVAVESMIEVAD